MPPRSTGQIAHVHRKSPPARCSSTTSLIESHVYSLASKFCPRERERNESLKVFLNLLRTSLLFIFSLYFFLRFSGRGNIEDNLKRKKGLILVLVLFRENERFLREGENCEKWEKIKRTVRDDLEDKGKKGDGTINDKGRSGGKKLTNLAWKRERGEEICIRA